MYKGENFDQSISLKFKLFIALYDYIKEKYLTGT